MVVYICGIIVINGMKKDKLILENIVRIGNIEESSINFEQMEALHKREFALADLDISARVLLHWHKSGLLPDGTTVPKGKHKFNFFELIYLYLIQDLRDFGLSIERIKKVKEFLLNEMDVIEMIKMQKPELIDIFKSLGYDASHLELIEDHKEMILQHADLIPTWFRRSTILTKVILWVIYKNYEINVIVNRAGEVFIQMMNQQGQFPKDVYNETPHIVLPLFNYVSRFISQEKYNELVKTFAILNERELLILNLVREGKYKEITVKFKKNDQITLEMVEEIKKENAKRIGDILIQKGYQKLELKSYDGEITYSTLRSVKDI